MNNPYVIENVGAAEGCDLLILKQNQKIAAFGSSYKGRMLTEQLAQAIPEHAQSQ